MKSSDKRDDCPETFEDMEPETGNTVHDQKPKRDYLKCFIRDWQIDDTKKVMMTIVITMIMIGMTRGCTSI